MSFDRDKIWGPNRAAAKREQNRPKLINNAIDQACREGTRQVELFFDTRADAEEMAAYINAHSSYEAKAEEVQRETLFEEHFLGTEQQRLIQKGFINLERLMAKYCEPFPRQKRYRTAFTLPVVSEASLAEYEKRCKAYSRHREEEMERLLKLQRNGPSGWVHELPPLYNNLPMSDKGDEDPTNE